MFFRKAKPKVRGFEMKVVEGRPSTERVLARAMGRLANLQQKKARWLLRKKDIRSPAHRDHFDEMIAEMEMLEKQIEYCNRMLGVTP